MTPDATRALLDELDQLLEAERTALLAGKLDEIARLLALKEDLIARVGSADGIDEARLTRAQEKIVRNQDLLAGALDGIRSVMDRMNGLRRVRAGLDTYDEAGQRRKISTPTRGTVEKRA